MEHLGLPMEHYTPLLNVADILGKVLLTLTVL